MSILTLDLQTAEFTTVFKAPDGAWIGYVNASPDNEQLLMSYSLPQNDSASTSFGLQALYTMPLDGSDPPQLLFPPPSDKDEYYQPEWSPDGQYVYFTHANYQSSTTYEIMRMAYPNGKPEHVVDQAYWPRLSRDGAGLVYVSIDPETGTNGLFVSRSDGAQASPIPLLGTSWTSTYIDAPMFLPDNQTLLFSGPSAQQSSGLNWIEKLTGVRVALAHASIPSDWWSVPLTGGQPAQLTHIYSLGLFGSLSPDTKYVASYSVDGIFVMQPDGTSLTKVVSTTGSTSGTVSWIP
jgi:Tol biopolymer transport system component